MAEQVQVDAENITVKEYKRLYQERRDNAVALEWLARAAAEEYYMASRDSFRYDERSVLRGSQFCMLIDELQKLNYTFRDDKDTILYFEKIVTLDAHRWEPITTGKCSPHSAIVTPSKMDTKLVIEIGDDGSGFAMEHLLGLLDDYGMLIKDPSYRLQMECCQSYGHLTPRLRFEDDCDGVFRGSIDRTRITEEGVAKINAVFDKIASGDMPICYGVEWTDLGMMS